MIWVSNTSRVCFESGRPHVDKACFELCLPYTRMAGLNLGVQT